MVYIQTVHDSVEEAPGIYGVVKYFTKLNIDICIQLYRVVEFPSKIWILGRESL
jgi:hypothetical protein